jgi:ketosteroid isomerase-like protein
MSSEAHERLLREGFEAFNSGDLSRLTAILDERVESRVGPGLVNSGTWHGIEGFQEMIGAWGESFESQRNTVLGTRSPDEHHVVAEVHQAAVGAISGVPVEMTIYYLVEIRDGRLRRIHLYSDAESALAAVR